MAKKKTDAANSIYAELSKAVDGVTPNDGEEENAFLVRLTEAVAALEDSVFSELSAPAQKWFNAAGEAINADTPEKIPALPGLPEIEAVADEVAEEETESPPEDTPSTEPKEKEVKAKTAPKSSAKKLVTVKKDTPAVKKAAPVATKKAPVGRVGVHADGAAITLIVKENPKREGSDSHKRFALYSKHKTVAAFLKAGGSRSDLRYDTEHKYIKIG